MEADQVLKKSVIEPILTHNATFILLHDRGSSGVDFQNTLCNALLPNLVSQVAPGARFVFPDGPLVDPTTVGRDWYDLEYPQIEGREAASLNQWTHVMYAAEQIDIVVKDEERLIGREKIFLGGVGKGCAIAMTTLLEMNQPIGGFIGFGGWMPFIKDIKDVATLGMIQTPNPPFSQNNQYNQGGIGGMAPGGQQQQPFPQAIFPTPDSNQSAFARHKRVARFLRMFQWNEASRFRYEDDFGTATPIVLMHSPNDEVVDPLLAIEAEMMLTELGYGVKLKSSDCGHTITRQVLGDFISILIQILPLSNASLKSDLTTFMVNSTT
ncbi:hypothetical protein BHE90_013469 [Fusarium euwallaceae]|uniref:Phospholipase/carboxylesterase/thioesterase domain-containing protein n=1 Tax=Fusarium euwallaceae TaxID=1147111 RepID=A0A430L8R0_9HYPO|nr:hypothetical protein BHE90_013469 [Fusarium euwallaceae]